MTPAARVACLHPWNAARSAPCRRSTPALAKYLERAAVARESSEPERRDAGPLAGPASVAVVLDAAAALLSAASCSASSASPCCASSAFMRSTWPSSSRFSSKA